MKKLIGFVVLSMLLVSMGCRTPEKRAAAFIQRGKALFAKGEFDRAVLEFRNAAQLKARDAEVQYQLGMAYLAAGNVSAGVQALMAAETINPQHPGVQMKLAELMLSTDDAERVADARKRLGAVLAMTPNNE